jgi:hypothetical protein
VIAKHGFGLGLRDEQNKREASIGLAEVAQACLGGPTKVEMDEETSAGIAAAHQRLSESEALEDFQAASLYPERARFVGAVQCAVDHTELHAKAGQPGRERQTGRAGTHNQDVEHSRARFGICALHHSEYKTRIRRHDDASANLLGTGH